MERWAHSPLIGLWGLTHFQLIGLWGINYLPLHHFLPYFDTRLVFKGQYLKRPIPMKTGINFVVNTTKYHKRGQMPPGLPTGSPLSGMEYRPWFVALILLATCCSFPSLGCISCQSDVRRVLPVWLDLHSPQVFFRYSGFHLLRNWIING
jgi:hypothetical protein